MCIPYYKEDTDLSPVPLITSKLPASEIYVKLGIHLKYRLSALLYWLQSLFRQVSLIRMFGLIRISTKYVSFLNRRF